MFRPSSLCQSCPQEWSNRNRKSYCGYITLSTLTQSSSCNTMCWYDQYPSPATPLPNSKMNRVCFSGRFSAFPHFATAASLSLYFFPSHDSFTFFSCSSVKFFRPNPNSQDWNVLIIMPIPSSLGMTMDSPFGPIHDFLVKVNCLKMHSLCPSKINCHCP